MGVHSGGGIIQNQNSGLFQQGPGNTQPLLLTAGDIGASLLDVGIVALGEAADEFIGTSQTAGVNQFLVGGVWIAPAQILLDGAGEQGILLEHHLEEPVAPKMPTVAPEGMWRFTFCKASSWAFSE